jgi:hypothetical protein
VLNEFFYGKSFRIELDNEAPATVDAPYEGTGYQFEAAQVQRCLKAGLTESPQCPLDETLAIMHSLDQLVSAWGIDYPPSS